MPLVLQCVALNLYARILVVIFDGRVAAPILKHEPYI